MKTVAVAVAVAVAAAVAVAVAVAEGRKNKSAAHPRTEKPKNPILRIRNIMRVWGSRLFLIFCTSAPV